ncbi:MAG: hypothetical protein K2R98_32710 [Gemmataceae bacterium]|nr:hypothetical protein [Gemmataceae bacterium]
MRFTFPLTTVALGLVLSSGMGAEPATDAARNQMVEWMKANNAWGPNSGVVNTMRNEIDNDVRDNRNYCVGFGNELTRSKKPYLLYSFSGQFYVFELTDTQARELEISPRGNSYSTLSVNRDQRVAPSLVQIAKPSIDNARGIDGTKPLTGKVSLKLLNSLPANTAVRLCYSAGGSTSCLFHYLDNLPQKDGEVSFSFKPINAEREKKVVGPLVVFIDLCTVRQVNGQVEIKVLGNTQGIMLEVARETRVRR